MGKPEHLRVIEQSRLFELAGLRSMDVDLWQRELTVRGISGCCARDPEAQGQAARPELGHAANYLWMCTGVEPTPDIARAMFEAGPRESRLKLARFLELETEAGRLDCPDPLQAAEFFAGMVIGSHQSAALLGIPVTLTEEKIDRIAVEAATRFLKAYAPA